NFLLGPELRRNNREWDPAEAKSQVVGDFKVVVNRRSCRLKNRKKILCRRFQKQFSSNSVESFALVGANYPCPGPFRTFRRDLVHNHSPGSPLQLRVLCAQADLEHQLAKSTVGGALAFQFQKPKSLL